jgi:hypothetical protein
MRSRIATTSSRSLAASRGNETLADDGHGRRVDRGAEDGPAGVWPVFRLDREADGLLRDRQEGGLVIGPRDALDAGVGRLVFAEIAVEAPAEDERAARVVVDLDRVAAEVERVDEVGAAPGPRPLLIDLVQGERLLRRAARVVIVDAQGLVDEPGVEGGSLLGPGAAGDGDGQDDEDEQALHGPSLRAGRSGRPFP